MIGKSTLTQVSIGFQLGGQAYSEIVFFQTKQALDNFKLGHLKLDAQASAIALTARASADLAYRNGVAIVTMAKGGLMYEASVGGQKFSFTPVGKLPAATERGTGSRRHGRRPPSGWISLALSCCRARSYPCNYCKSLLQKVMSARRARAAPKQLGEPAYSDIDWFQDRLLSGHARALRSQASPPPARPPVSEAAVTARVSMNPVTTSD